jgi:hypothetical protein
MKNKAAAVVSLCLIILHVYAAAVQWNDPDAAVWMGLYGGAAMLVATQEKIPLPRWAYGILSIAAALWGLRLGFSSTGSDGILAIEERREMGGLFIVASTMIWLSARSKKRGWSQGQSK